MGMSANSDDMRLTESDTTAPVTSWRDSAARKGRLSPSNAPPTEPRPARCYEAMFESEEMPPPTPSRA